MKIGCVLMAAGRGARYGSNKLLHNFLDQPLYQYVMDALPMDLLERVAVVTGYEAIAQAAKERGMTCVVNDQPEEGASLTVRLGVQALSDLDALMFAVADQPLLRQESVRKLIRCFQEHPDRIVALGHDGRRGNPVIFPRPYYDELRQLIGNNGGTCVIRAHPGDVFCCEIPDERQMWDVDTVSDMERLKMEAGRLSTNEAF